MSKSELKKRPLNEIVEDAKSDAEVSEEEEGEDDLEEQNSEELTIQDGTMKRKQKRRSKNDIQGRDHKCTFCDKTYLSYPALYTHMKNKHAKGPDGQPLINFNSGRGRGRPKKNSHLFPLNQNQHIQRL